MDIVDIAQEREALFREAETRHALSLRDDGCELVSLTHCEICGERIPEARRVAVPGVRMCIVCQEEFDGIDMIDRRDG